LHDIDPVPWDRKVQFLADGDPVYVNAWIRLFYIFYADAEPFGDLADRVAFLHYVLLYRFILLHQVIVYFIRVTQFRKFAFPDDPLLYADSLNETGDCSAFGILQVRSLYPFEDLLGRSPVTEAGDVFAVNIYREHLSFQQHTVPDLRYRLLGCRIQDPAAVGQVDLLKVDPAGNEHIRAITHFGAFP